MSYEVGLVKPDPAMFEHVVETLGVQPDSIVFLDDNEINVEQARAVGLEISAVLNLSHRAAPRTRRRPGADPRTRTPLAVQRRLKLRSPAES